MRKYNRAEVTLAVTNILLKAEWPMTANEVYQLYGRATGLWVSESAIRRVLNSLYEDNTAELIFVGKSPRYQLLNKREKLALMHVTAVNECLFGGSQIGWVSLMKACESQIIKRDRQLRLFELNEKKG